MNILGLVVVAVGFGIVISSMKEEGKPLADFFNALEAATMKLIIVVIWYVKFTTILQSFFYTPTTFTCDQYAHHVVMDTFLNANNSKQKDLREWKSQKK